MLGVKSVAAIVVRASLVAVAAARGTLAPSYLAALGGSSWFLIGLVATLLLGLVGVGWRFGVRSRGAIQFVDKRPTIVDDRNFYLPAGVRKWVRSGFLNKDLKISLGALGPMRTQIEAELLLQNLMLTLQAMGLGGWIHAAIGPPYLLGHPYFAKETRGLAFRHEVPRSFFLLELLRWGSVLPILRANPVGLDGIIQAMCPPHAKLAREALAQAGSDTELARPIGAQK